MSPGGETHAFAGRRAHDEEVLPHLARTARLHAAAVPSARREAFAHVHDPVGAEAADRLAALGVDRLEIPVDRKQQPLSRPSSLCQ